MPTNKYSLLRHQAIFRNTLHSKEFRKTIREPSEKFPKLPPAAKTGDTWGWFGYRCQDGVA